MSFLPYNLKFYKNMLDELENSPVTSETKYKAKQLLKFVEDITDEGYPSLYEALEADFNGVKRLRNYIIASGETPFTVREKSRKEINTSYEYEETELDEFLEQLLKFRTESGSATMLTDALKRFCTFIGHDDDTEYIFLLRDTLLPFLRFRAGYENSRAWLIIRDMINSLTETDNADDIIVRSVINDALESGKTRDYDEFKAYCAPRIRKNLASYPKLINALTQLLSSVFAPKITVIESGVYGTFPMLLSSLDERVDVRMFTSIPFLADTYSDRLFTREYEINRFFETLVSQDKLFRFSSFRDGKFYIQKASDAETLKLSLAEISEILN